MQTITNKYDQLLYIFIIIFLAIFIGVVSLNLTWLIIAVFFVLTSAWLYFSYRHIKQAYLVLLVFLTLLYSRLSIEISGHTLSLFDFLFVTFFFVLIIRFLICKQKKLVMPSNLNITNVFVLLFIFIAVVLPFFSIFLGFDINNITSGIRFLMWIIFALVGVILVQNDYNMLQKILSVFIVVSLIHTLYAFLQYGVFVRLLTEDLLFLDRIYEKQHSFAWFFWWRATGLFVNPNSYGMYSAIVALIELGIILTRIENSGLRKLALCAFPFTVVGILLSGSRTGLLCFFLPSLLMLLIARNIKAIGLFIFGGLTFIILFIFISRISDATVTERMMGIINVLSEGVSGDRNMIGRVVQWEGAISNYLEYYPFGTWAPPSNVFNMAIDSYYVYTLTQGTPVFTILFSVMIIAIIFRCYKMFRLHLYEQPLHSCIALINIGTTFSIAIGSASMSPLLQPFLAVIFWELIFMSMLLKGIR